jgi:hypothetical protein
VPGLPTRSTSSAGRSPNRWALTDLSEPLIRTMTAREVPGGHPVADRSRSTPNCSPSADRRCIALSNAPAHLVPPEHGRRTLWITVTARCAKSSAKFSGVTDCRRRENPSTLSTHTSERTTDSHLAESSAVTGSGRSACLPSEDTADGRLTDNPADAGCGISRTLREDGSWRRTTNLRRS